MTLRRPAILDKLSDDAREAVVIVAAVMGIGALLAVVLVLGLMLPW